MRCNRCHDKPATRRVNLVSSVVNITRDFCDECATYLCADEPKAGATGPGGKRELLRGLDLGPVPSEN
jgi:hypothetical protein